MIVAVSIGQNSLLNFRVIEETAYALRCFGV